MLSVVKQSVMFLKYYTECLYAEYNYTEYGYAEYGYAEYGYTEYGYAECRCTLFTTK
jgi:hypothetical protein